MFAECNTSDYSVPEQTGRLMVVPSVSPRHCKKVSSAADAVRKLLLTEKRVN